MLANGETRCDELEHALPTSPMPRNQTRTSILSTIEYVADTNLCTGLILSHPLSNTHLEGHSNIPQIRRCQQGVINQTRTGVQFHVCFNRPFMHINPKPLLDGALRYRVLHRAFGGRFGPLAASCEWLRAC